MIGRSAGKHSYLALAGWHSQVKGLGKKMSLFLIESHFYSEGGSHVVVQIVHRVWIDSHRIAVR